MAKAGVMGWPISHSLSPRLHSYWLNKFGISGSYEALAVEPAQLEKLLRELPAKGFRGVNLTIPHKEAALSIVDETEGAATFIGAVNTIIVMPDGKLLGRNTDAYGFSQNLLSSGADVKGKTATVLGAGGAARAVIVALQTMGTGEIRIANRTRQRAETLKSRLGGNIKVVDWDPTALRDCALLVNATSLGMQSQPALEITLDTLPVSAIVTDLVYTPLMTDLLKNAQARGHKTIDGLGMLLHQGRPAFNAFFGRDPEVTEELRNHMLAAR